LWQFRINCSAAEDCKSRQAAADLRQDLVNCGQRRKNWRQRRSKTRRTDSNCGQNCPGRGTGSEVAGRGFSICGKGKRIAGGALEIAAGVLKKTAAAEAGRLGVELLPALLRGSAVARFSGKTLTVTNSLMACAFHFLETASWCQHFSENIFETAVQTLSPKTKKPARFERALDFIRNYFETSAKHL